MSTEKGSLPKLLIGNYDSLENIEKKIACNNYSCIDNVVPMQRCRGTIMNNIARDKGIAEIIGWQRDITIMRKMDVSLPFIVKMTLSDGAISDISIGKSFNGGKGLLCSKEYLENRLRSIMLGKRIDKVFLNNTRLSNIHCFHIYEILNSIYSSYNAVESDEERRDGIFYEEEVSDCYTHDGNMYIAGQYKSAGMDPQVYRMEFYDIFNRVSFSTDGYLRLVGEVEANFYLNDVFQFDFVLTQSENDYMFIQLQKFLLKCVSALKSRVFPQSRTRMMNTNLTPGAMVGVLFQAIALRSFKDNFTYIQHVFTAMQRPGKKPGCIGSILSSEEAESHFPGYNYDELY